MSCDITQNILLFRSERTFRYYTLLYFWKEKRTHRRNFLLFFFLHFLLFIPSLLLCITRDRSKKRERKKGDDVSSHVTFEKFIPTQDFAFIIRIKQFLFLLITIYLHDPHSTQYQSSRKVTLEKIATLFESSFHLHSTRNLKIKVSRI